MKEQIGRIFTDDGTDWYVVVGEAISGNAVIQNIETQEITEDLWPEPIYPTVEVRPYNFEFVQYVPEHIKKLVLKTN